MQKTELIQQIEMRFSALESTLKSVPTTDFSRSFNGKWSAGQQGHHLILSSRPVNLALTLPKAVLWVLFGKNNRTEKSYDEVVARYLHELDNGLTAPTPYRPKAKKDFQKDRILHGLNGQKKKFIRQLRNWNEEQLSTYLVPHPAMGKMTIREILMFTLYHIEHHRLQVEAMLK